MRALSPHSESLWGMDHFLSDSDLDSDLDSELEQDVVACVALAIGHTILSYGAQFDKTLQHTSILSG